MASAELTNRRHIMGQVYSDPTRESDPYALPDIEVFVLSQLEANYNLENLDHADEYTLTKAGWYWWSCFPGCYPHSIASGPFDSPIEAIADSRNEVIRW
jgi:hypothetical protein